MSARTRRSASRRGVSGQRAGVARTWMLSGLAVFWVPSSRAWRDQCVTARRGTPTWRRPSHQRESSRERSREPECKRSATGRAGRRVQPGRCVEEDAVDLPISEFLRAAEVPRHRRCQTADRPGPGRASPPQSTLLTWRACLLWNHQHD